MIRFYFLNLICTIITLFLGVSALASDLPSLIDSLELEITKTTDIKVLSDCHGLLSDLYLDFSLEKAQYHADISLDYARQTKDINYESLALIGIGNIAFAEGKYQKALYYYEGAQKRINAIPPDSSNIFTRITCLINLALVYTWKDSIPKAKSLFEDIIFLASQNPDSSSTGYPSDLQYAYEGLSNCYFLEGDHQSSMEYCRKAIGQNKYTHDYRVLRPIYSRIAWLYFDQGEHDSTQYYQNLALDLLQIFGTYSPFLLAGY
jgi:tetratricopeptide (TPR) repeat protein